MEKIITYLNDFIREIGIYHNHFIEEYGIMIFVVILLAAILILLLIWQKIRIRKVRADFFENKLLDME